MGEEKRSYFLHGVRVLASELAEKRWGKGDRLIEKNGDLFETMHAPSRAHHRVTLLLVPFAFITLFLCC